MLGRYHHFRDDQPPSPLWMLDFPWKKWWLFLEYGGGWPQELGISQIVQPIVRLIELGAKWGLAYTIMTWIFWRKRYRVNTSKPQWILTCFELMKTPRPCKRCPRLLWRGSTKAPFTCIRIFLNPKLFLSGYENIRVHTLCDHSVFISNLPVHTYSDSLRIHSGLTKSSHHALVRPGLTRVSRKLRPRKLTPQRVSRKLRPEKLRP